jgi:hypothetical protein
MNALKDMPLLPPFCPHCHKSFFWSGPAWTQQKKSCQCKKGRKLFTDWMNTQSQLMSEMTDPTESIVPNPAIEVTTPDEISPVAEVETSEVLPPADPGDSCNSVDEDGVSFKF